MKKINSKLLFCLSVLTLSLSSCTPTNPYADDPRYDIYVLAKADGYEGTYEEWLESIRGEDGENGQTPHIGENGNWWIGDTDTGVPATGPQGPQGPQGEPGKDGNSLHTGNGVPNSTLGKNGDSYIDLDTWDYYVKENGTWVLKGNIQSDGGNEYVPEIHEVTFNTNGGSVVETQYIEHGKKITMPVEPTKEDYVFDGWTYMGEEWKFNIYTVAEDMTLDANWTYSPKLPDVPSEPEQSDIPVWFSELKAKERNTNRNLPFSLEYDEEYGYHYVIDTSSVTTSTFFTFNEVEQLDPKFYLGYELSILVEGDVSTNIIAWSEDWTSNSDTVLGTHEVGIWKTSVLSLTTWNGNRGSKAVGFYDIMTKGKIRVTFGRPIQLQTEGNHKLYHDNVIKYLTAENEADIIKALRRNTPYNDQIRKRLYIDNPNKKEFTIVFADNEKLNNSIQYKTTSDYFDIPYNLLPRCTYYYQIIDNTGADVGKVQSFVVDDSFLLRTLNVDGVVNIRDIGGWVTTNKEVIKYGKIFRGGRLKSITSLGREQLFNELGVKTEIDVRNDGSQESGHSHNYLKYGMGQYTEIIPGYKSPNRIHTVTGENIGPVGFSSSSVTSIGNIFKSLADEKNYPVYIHCNHGADRTGTIIYLLNGLLGVPYEQLVQDFELTTFSKSGSRYRSYITDKGEFDTTSEYAGISECSEQNYVAFGKLHELIMTNYGQNKKTLQEAIENYLTSVCGVSTSDIIKIKSILLG